jgi:pseudouridine-5'-phosphate glycosidase
LKHPNLIISTEVSKALDLGSPVVALESTVITHGLPRPQNLELARDMESQVRKAGATPATIALLDGQIRVGLSDADLVRLSESRSILKVSHRDFATAIVKKMDGGTTVAGIVVRYLHRPACAGGDPHDRGVRRRQSHSRPACHARKS